MSTNSVPDNDLPEGFKPSSVQGPQSWFQYEGGATLQGRLLGRIQRRNQDGSFYQVKVTAECNAKVSFKEERDGESKIVPVAIGDVICVDEKSAIAHWAPLCTDGGEYEVYMKVISKDKIDGGRTFWNIKPGVKVLRAPKRQPIGNNDHSDNSDIPF